MRSDRVLVKPGLESTGRPDLSTLVSQLSSSLVDFWMVVELFRDVLKSFPKLFTGRHDCEVQPVILPFSSRWQLDVTSPEVTLSLKLSQ